MGKRSRSESRPAWGMSVNRQITKVQCTWRRALRAEERMSLRLGVSVVLKRAFDVVCAAAGLLFLSPLLLWIAWRIRREDRGPVFYRGERVGLHGKPFRIYKFRTMGGGC